MHSCFFCDAQHGLSEKPYGMPLYRDGLKMERWQILLLQQVAFMQSSPYELTQAWKPGHIMLDA